MAKNLSAIRNTVRQVLLDEFVAGETQDWKEDELDVIIGQVVQEISEHSPLVVKETLTLTSGSREFSIATIEALIDIYRLEWPVDKNPQEFRNFTRWGTTVRIDTDLTPGADSVYLYCDKPHTLSESTSTLSPRHERILVDGACAYAVLNWVNKLRPRITAAIADIASALTKINTINEGGPNVATQYLSAANTEMGAAGRILETTLTIGNSKLALYRAELNKITEPRSYQEWPKD